MKRLTLLSLLLCALLIFTLPVGAQATSCDATTDYASQGQTAYDAGEYSAAADAFVCAAQVDRTNYPLWVSYVKAAILGERYTDAYVANGYLVLATEEHVSEDIAALIAGFESDPQDVNNLKLLAYFANVAADLIMPVEEANIYIDAFLALAPDDAFANYLKANMLSLYGVAEEALPYYDRAIELAPENPHILGAVGSDLDYYHGQTEQALAYLTQAIELNPNIAALYLLRADIYYYVSGDSDSAMADYDRAAEMVTYNLTVYTGRGYVRFYNGDIEGALADAERAVELNPRSTLAYLLLFESNWAAGNVDSGSAALQNFIDLREGNEMETLQPDTPATVTMENGVTFSFPIAAEAGQSLTLSAQSPVDGVDVIIYLFDANGLLVAYNDDVDMDNGDYNAQVADVAVTESGTYTLVVTHSGGTRNGDVEVTLTVAS